MQLTRFGVAGGITTALYAIVYWPIATYMPHAFTGSRLAGGFFGGIPVQHRNAVGKVTPGAWPSVGNVLGYLAAMLSGYLLHSRWSFKGHGERDNLARTSGRFFAVSLVSFGLNSLFVGGFTGPLLHWPTWTPLVPITFFTPVVTFALQRWWVFG